MAWNRTAWNALVDDDGSNTVGTLFTKTQIANVGAPVIQTDTGTGSVNNFALTADCRYLYVNNATLRTYTGFTAGYNGQELTVISIGAGNFETVYQSASSSAANQFLNFATSGNTPGAAGAGRMDYIYDTSAAAGVGRWRLVHHEQGDWITPTFDALHYQGSASMTWTLTAGDRTGQAYWLRGKSVISRFALDTTTVGGTASTDLQIKNGAWGGFTAGTGQWNGTMYHAQDKGVLVEAFIQINGGGTAMRILKKTFATWDITSVNQTEAYGEIELGVS